MIFFFIIVAVMIVGFYLGQRNAYRNIIKTDLIKSGVSLDEALLIVDSVNSYLDDTPIDYYLTIAESFQNKVFVFYVKPLDANNDEARLVLEYDSNSKEIKIVAFGTAFPELHETYPYLKSI